MTENSKLNILVLCTGNSCRSIMAEALINHYGSDQFTAFSAGSKPSGRVHPTSLKTLTSQGIKTDGYHSKSWDEFATQKIDIVITVCGNAAAETCPIYTASNGQHPLKTHWGVEDPDGHDDAEFLRVFKILEKRVRTLVNRTSGIPITQQFLNEIGQLIQ